jgi:hypothetical protein
MRASQDVEPGNPLSAVLRGHSPQILLRQLGSLGRLTPVQSQGSTPQDAEIVRSAVGEQALRFLPPALATAQVAQPDERNRHHARLDSLHVPAKGFDFPFSLLPLTAEGKQGCVLDTTS